MYGRRVGLQEVLDQLDFPCARKDLERVFRPQVRDAIAHHVKDAPDSCIEAIMDVADYIARAGDPGGEPGGGKKLPQGIGGWLVAHFLIRSSQIAELVGETVMPIEARFALIQLAVLAFLRHAWLEQAPFEGSVASHRARLREVALPPTRSSPESDAWINILTLFLSRPHIIALLRNIVYAFVWAGFVMPGRTRIPDLVIAKFLDEGREQFNRFKQEGLRFLLAMRILGVGTPVRA
jgi:hypothetical protein